MEATHILKLSHDLGMTETIGFNRNLIHLKFDEIKVHNVKRNPNAKRVYFVSITNPQVLKTLVESFDINRKIEQTYIEHNQFAVYGYQLKEIKKSKPVTKKVSTSNSKVFLENYIKMISNPNHWYSTGNQSNVEERFESNMYSKQFEENAKSYVKSQKILIVRTTYAEKITRHNMFNKIPRTYSIEEVTIHRAYTRKIKKNQWVGDGYEDVEVETIQYATDTHLVTVHPMSLQSVPLN